MRRILDNNILEQYKRIIHLIKGQIGDSCQAILYGITSDNSGYIISFCGTITNMDIGEAMPSYLNEYITSPSERYGFINKNVPGYVLRTSVHCIYNETDRLIGLLCIHHNLLPLQMISSFLDELIKSENLEDENILIDSAHSESKKYEASDIQDFLDQIMIEFLHERIGFNDFSRMSKNDKLDLIAELDNKGVFLIKGAVNQIAKRINTSKFTIYNYLDEIRTINVEK